MKFQVSGILITQATKEGKLPAEIISDFTDLYNSISHWSTYASWAQMAQGVSNAALNGISDGAAADILAGQLSKNNPANVQKGVTDSLNKLTKILEENRLVGAMISIKYRCRKCICDKDGVWGWDWPDEQRSPFVIDDNNTDGEVVYHLKDSSGGGERLEVSKVQPWHITEAIELARKSCEGE
jgi:hypothetical protein